MLGRTALRRFAGKAKDIKVPLSSFDPHLLPKGLAVPASGSISSDELVSGLKDMFTIRRLEMVLDGLYKTQKIRGFCHLYDGQEAIAVGLDQILTPKDPLIQAYRHHGACVMRKIPVYNIICELIMKKDGWTKGKGGSMHLYDREHDYFGGNGIVGAQCPVGTGLAFALKYEGNKENVAAVMYGDGAANQGQLYEAANIASLWKLPVVYICENNNFAMGTSVARHSAGGGDFHKKIYNVPGLKVDGHSLVEVREATKFAKKFALEHGPIVLNMITYRYHGHSMSDPGSTYRNREEVTEKRRTVDCIKLAEDLILANKVMTEQELEDFKNKITAEVDADRDRALASENISPQELLTDVYSPDFKHFLRGKNYEDSIFVKQKLIE